MDRLSRPAFTGAMAATVDSERTGTTVTAWGGAALVAATLCTGLMAGLFFTYANSVLPGLGKADDRTLVDAMQRINVAILNGWFGLAFAGALLTTIAAAVLHLRDGGRPALPWIVAGLVLYVVVLVITFAVNVPLNDELARGRGRRPDPRSRRRPRALRGELGPLEHRPRGRLLRRVRLPDLGPPPARAGNMTRASQVAASTQTTGRQRCRSGSDCPTRSTSAGRTSPGGRAAPRSAASARCPRSTGSSTRRTTR